MKLRNITIINALLLLCASQIVQAQPNAKTLFSAQAQPTHDTATAYGSYAAGCLAGAVALPESTPTWQMMRLSRNRNWGHPELLKFIERLSNFARDAGWAGLYVGDISQPRGGPLNGGHRSHQIGLDADIWLRAGTDLSLSRQQREEISSHIVVRKDKLGVNQHWTPIHHAVLRAAASDSAVARIFVNPAIKRKLCDDAATYDRDWLRKIRPWYGHSSHFHVRLHCPPNQPLCANQAPIPAGDGCGKGLDWWFSDAVRNPKPNPNPKPRRQLTLGDLPAACATLVQ